MKYFIVTFFILAIISCNQKDSVQDYPFSAGNMPADSSALQVNTTYDFSSLGSSQIWRASRGNMGVSGSFTAPITAGKLTVTAISPSDSNVKITRTYFVSTQKNLFDSMLSGGYVLAFRHAAASDGSDVFGTTASQWWLSCSNTVARQLTTPTGFVQAAELGLCMRIFKLPVNRLISSEYCRCKTTAQLFAQPNVAVTTNQDITYYAYDEPNRYPKQMALINASPINNSNTVMVGHAGFAGTPTPTFLGNLNWGDAAVFKLNAGGAAATYITTLTEVALRQMLQ